MPTIEISPAVSGDDGRRDSINFVVNSLCQVGLASTRQRFAWLRFPNVTVPAGSTVTAAYIVMTKAATFGAGSVLSKVYGIAEDDHVAPTTNAEWTTDHGVHTTASVDFDFTASGSGTDQSPSIVSVIQEIVDRSGWASGNAIGIHIDDDGSADGTFQDWQDVDSGTEAVLHIEYEEGLGERAFLMGVW